jgi:flagellar protein FlgJ
MAGGISGIGGIPAFDSTYIPLSGRSVPGTEGEFSSLVEKAQREADSPGPPIRKDQGIDTKLYEQCEALETFLIKNMLSQMRKTVMKADLVDTGFAGEVYEDMLWDEYAKEYTKKAQLGLAKLAYLELSGQRGKKLLP